MLIASREKETFVSKDLKTLAPSLGLLLFSLALAFLAYRVGLSIISSKRTVLQKLKREETVLLQKQQILQEINDTVAFLSEASVVAVPDKNPVLALISQIKNLAGAREISLENIKVGAETKADKGLSKIDLSFDVEGDLVDIIDFMLALKTIAPISIINKSQVNQVGEAARAEIDVLVFWSPFPEKIPSLTEPINKLTDKEQEQLENISSLIPPPFTEMAPAAPFQRANPFAIE